jgi:hypothetical protein
MAMVGEIGREINKWRRMTARYIKAIFLVLGLYAIFSGHQCTTDLSAMDNAFFSQLLSDR